MNATNEDIGWFAPLSKEIGEKSTIAMIVVIEAHKIAELLAHAAPKHLNLTERELFPIAVDVLTALVSSQVSVDAIKERYREGASMREMKAAVEQAVSSWREPKP